MGAYVYRVTAQRVKCTDGKEANVAILAYKPVHDPVWDQRAAFVSGVYDSERLVNEGRVSGRVVQGYKTDKGDIVVDAKSKVYDFAGASFYGVSLGIHIKELKGVVTI